jgi:nucleotide-binding universal stress UspA family protein
VDRANRCWTPASISFEHRHFVGGNTMRVRRILCATDFSASADSALEHAVMLARGLHAEIKLLHVYQRSAGNTMALSARAAGRSEQDASTRYHRQLDELIARYADRDVSIDVVLAEGPAWERILNTAKELAADMIVIGRNGRAGLSQLFVGSTATRIVKHATAPVLVVRA